MGCREKLPKEQELPQLPGRGNLDFIPIVAALKSIEYKDWTEVFMHMDKVLVIVGDDEAVSVSRKHQVATSRLRLLSQ